MLYRMRNQLPELRADRGWSQDHLAQKLNVSRQTINSLERGRYRPSLDLAYKIAQLFNLTIEEVFFVDQCDHEPAEPVDA